MGAVTVYLVRHGETQANREGIMQGQLDTELNAEGLDQARRTAAALDRVRFAAAHSSDLARAVKVRFRAELSTDDSCPASRQAELTRGAAFLCMCRRRRRSWTSIPAWHCRRTRR